MKKVQQRFHRAGVYLGKRGKHFIRQLPVPTTRATGQICIKGQHGLLTFVAQLFSRLECCFGKYHKFFFFDSIYKATV